MGTTRQMVFIYIWPHHLFIWMEMSVCVKSFQLFFLHSQCVKFEREGEEKKSHERSERILLFTDKLILAAVYSFFPEIRFPYNDDNNFYNFRICLEDDKWKNVVRRGCLSVCRVSVVLYCMMSFALKSTADSKQWLCFARNQSNIKAIWFTVRESRRVSCL